MAEARGSKEPFGDQDQRLGVLVIPRIGQARSQIEAPQSFLEDLLAGMGLSYSQRQRSPGRMGMGEGGPHCPTSISQAVQNA